MKTKNKKLKECFDVIITFTLMLPVVLVLAVLASSHLMKHCTDLR